MSTSNTTGKNGQPKKRLLRLIKPFDQDGKNAEIRITMVKGNKREEFRYWVDRIPSEWVMAFLVEKIGDGTDLNDEYQVLLDTEKGHSCECTGFLRWDHCKHIAALAKLEELKKI